MPDIAICKPLYRVVIECTMLSKPIGLAGDVLYVPFYFSSGKIQFGQSTGVVCGDGDFAAIHFDEKMIHEGRFLVQSENGAALFFFNGTSQGADGTYDALVEGRLPGTLSSAFSVWCISADAQWRDLNWLHLPATGTVDIAAVNLEMTAGTLVRSYESALRADSSS